MKILKAILISAGALFLIYCIVAAVAPSSYKVTRSIKINAPIAVVFNQTSIFSNWASFSAWAKNDPEAVYLIENDKQEAGAIMEWNGPISGKGVMTTTEVVKNEKFLYEINFLEPFTMVSRGGFLYSQEEDIVLLEWIDEGNFSFFMRPMMLMMNVEAQIAPMFEQGLEAVKTICENKNEVAPIEITEEEVQSHTILYISESSTLNIDTMGAKMGAAYGELMALMGIAKLEILSAPIAITKKFSIAENICNFDAAIPVVSLQEGMEFSGRIQEGTTYGGKVLKTLHIGPYNTLKSTYDAVLAYIDEKGYEENGFSWEEYLNNPSEVATDKLMTNVYFPIK